MEIIENFRLQIYGPTMKNVQSEPVTQDDLEDIPRLKSYMMKVLERSRGVGLAAPQVGVFKQFVLVQRSDGSVLDFINPQVTRLYGKEIEEFEACLSLPPDGNQCLVPRLEFIDITASTSAAPMLVKDFSFRKFTARILQHELDHLTGTFFIDRVTEKRRTQVLDLFNRWKRMRSAAQRTSLKGKHHADAGLVTSHGPQSRLP